MYRLSLYIDYVIEPAFITALQTAGLYTQFMRNLAYGNLAICPAPARCWTKFKTEIYPENYVWDAFDWESTPEGHDAWKCFTDYWEEDILNAIM